MVSHSPLPFDLDALASEFGATEDLDRLREIASTLARPGVTHKAWSFPAFQAGVHRLLAASTAAEGDTRLKALALLARLMSQPSKAVQAAVREGLAQAAPALDTAPAGLADPQDREYLAQAVRLAAIPNRMAYLALLAAAERQHQSSARRTAILGLIESAPSLAVAFDALGEALAAQPGETQDVAVTRAKRLARVLDAVLSALRAIDPLVGVDVGPALARLLTTALGGAPLRDRDAAIEVAAPALEVLTAFVRPNFSLAREPQVFEAVAVLKRFFAPARWPDETLPARRSLANVLREAIALLAQAGVTDSRLRQILILLLEEHLAEAELRTLAEKAPGLTTQVRHWLTHGRAMRTLEGADVAAESLLETVDRDIAEAFRESAFVREAWSGMRGDLAEAALDASPILRQALALFDGRLERLTRRIALAAQKRELTLVDEAGEAVEYSPVDHEAEEALTGVRIVRVVAPRVTRRTRSGLAQIVLKARVEPT